MPPLWSAPLRTASSCGPSSSLPMVAHVYPSGGNFLLFELHEDQSAAVVRSWLVETHSIEVKDVTQRFPDRVPRLRVAVRIPEDNAQLVTALAQFCS